MNGANTELFIAIDIVTAYNIHSRTENGDQNVPTVVTIL